MADRDQTTGNLQRATCPACGFRTLALPPDRGERCAVCGWINDFQQLVHPDITYGANAGLSLQQAQRRLCPGSPQDPEQADGFERDPAWRPLQHGENPDDATGGSSPVCYIATPDPADYVPYWLRLKRKHRPSGD